MNRTAPGAEPRIREIPLSRLVLAPENKRKTPPKADAMVVRIASGSVYGSGGKLAAAEAEVTRLRLGLEESRPLRFGDGSVLTPGMEIALRRDGGDAETRFGAGIGVGLAWSDPERGLDAELRGRGLLAHEARGFRPAGLTGTLSWNPGTGGRGPRLSLTQTSDVAGRDAFGAPAGTGPVDDHWDRRLEARFGYGVAAFGGQFISTPEITVGVSAAGRDYVLGWRLARGGDMPDRSALELAVEARRRASPSDRNDSAEHAVGVRLTWLF